MKIIKIKLLSFLTISFLANLSFAYEAGIGRAVSPATPTDIMKPIGLPNPASKFCIENKGTLELVDNIGICKFNLLPPSACEEWAFFRGECKPGDCKEIKIVDGKAVCIK